VKVLAALGLSGAELALAPLVPSVEMAWADGVVGPDELAELDRLCEVVVRDAGLELGRARKRVQALVSRRLAAVELDGVLRALRDLFPGVEARRAIVDWAETIASVDDVQWDPRERAWSERLRAVLEVE
jgi:hypothetical protein